MVVEVVVVMEILLPLVLVLPVDLEAEEVVVDQLTIKELVLEVVEPQIKVMEEAHLELHQEQMIDILVAAAVPAERLGVVTAAASLVIRQAGQPLLEQSLAALEACYEQAIPRRMGEGARAE